MNNIFNGMKNSRKAEWLWTPAYFLNVLCGFLGDLFGLRFAPDSMRISPRCVRSQTDLYVG